MNPRRPARPVAPVIALLSAALLLPGVRAGAEPPAPAKAGAPTQAALFFARNQFEAARQAFAEAVAAAPERPAPRIGLIRSLLRLDRWEEARAEAGEAVKQFPDDGDLRGLLALAQVRAGELDAARESARRARQLEPFSFYAALALGTAEMWEGNTQRARQAFRRAIELRPNDPDGWLGRFEASDEDTDEKDDLYAAKRYLSLKPKGYPHDADVPSVASIVANWQAYKLHYDKGAMLKALAPINEQSLRRAERLGMSVEIRIAFTVRMGFVIVPVTLDGERFDLIFDSGGGNGVLLTGDAAKRLRRTKAQPVARSLVRGASGSEVTTQYKAARMTLGNGTLTLGPVAVDTVGAKPGLGDGIIGGPAFDNWAVTIDFPARLLVLRRGKDARAPQPTDGNYRISQPFRYRGGKILLPLRAEGQPLWGLVDSGASLDMYSLRMARRLSAGLPKEEVREGNAPLAVGIGSGAGGIDFRAFPKRMTLAYGHEGDNGAFDQPASIGLSILDKQVSPALGVEIGFLLGMPTLSLYERVTIDYPRRVLTLEAKRPAPAAPAAAGGAGQKMSPLPVSIGVPN